MNTNYWLSVTTETEALISECLATPHGEYDGDVSDECRDVCAEMVHYFPVERRFNRPIVDSNERRLYSITYADSLHAAECVFTMLAAWPDMRIEGAWWWDGRQLGTEWAFDQDGMAVWEEEIDGWQAQAAEGTPIFPIDHAGLLGYMPDVMMLDADGDPTIPALATELAQVHKESGQVDRRF